MFIAKLSRVIAKSETVFYSCVSWNRTRTLIKPQTRCFKRIGGRQSGQQYSRIINCPLFKPIYYLLPRKKKEKWTSSAFGFLIRLLRRIRKIAYLWLRIFFQEIEIVCFTEISFHEKEIRYLFIEFYGKGNVLTQINPCILYQSGVLWKTMLYVWLHHHGIIDFKFTTTIIYLYSHKMIGMYENLPSRTPHGVKAKVLNCRFEVREFELKAFYYVHLRLIDLEKEQPHFFISP